MALVCLPWAASYIGLSSSHWITLSSQIFKEIFPDLWLLARGFIKILARTSEWFKRPDDKVYSHSHNNVNQGAVESAHLEKLESLANERVYGFDCHLTSQWLRRNPHAFPDCFDIKWLECTNDDYNWLNEIALRYQFQSKIAEAICNIKTCEICKDKVSELCCRSKHSLSYLH